MRSLFLIFLFQMISSAQSDHLTGRSDGDILPEVQMAFDLMAEAAALDSIELKIVSGYRSFDRQKQIFEAKYKSYRKTGLAPEAAFDKVVQYSTVPGTSRHHWGTDIDLIDARENIEGDLLDPANFLGDAAYAKMFTWLQENAAEYGFVLVYTDHPSRPGFNYEPWHWSYAPLSRPFLKDYLSKVDFIPVLRSWRIYGIKSISDDRLNRYLEEHIKGINPELLGE